MNAYKQNFGGYRVQASVSYVNRFVSNGALRVKPGYVCSRVAEILEQPRAFAQRYTCALIWRFEIVLMHTLSTHAIHTLTQARILARFRTDL